MPRSLDIDNYYSINGGDNKIKKIIPPNFDIEKYLIDKGIKYKIHKSSRNGTWLQMRCPFPEHDDKKPSFSINVESLAYNCYVCGKGNWFKLCKKLGWKDWESDDVLVGVTPAADWNNAMKLLYSNDNKKEVYVALKPKNKKIVDGDKFYNYLKGRNLVKAIKTFNIRCCTDWDENYGSIYKNRITIPVHDLDGKNIIWYEGRSIVDDKKVLKYYRPDGVEKTRLLFNYHNAKKSGSKKIIIAEGILHAIQLWLWGYVGVCTFGAGISLDQLELLLEFDEIYICFDIDKAGIKAYDELKELIIETGIKIRRIKIPRGNDVNTISKNQFDEYYNNAVIINGVLKREKM
jgi:DNA primase